MQININDNGTIKAAIARLTNIERKQLPFATAKALTATAGMVKDRLRKEMGSVFDRPTPYTLNSLMLKPATKSRLTATVWLKDELGTSKGTPATKYLAPEVFGGGRRVKRFERALIAAGVMPAGMMAVLAIASSWAVKMDVYGNISRGQIVQLLSYFRAFGEQGYRANMTDQRKAKVSRIGQSKAGYKRIGGVVYFVSRGDRNLPRGIWAKRGTHGVDVAPVLLFVSPATYIQRLRFFDVAMDVVNRELVGQFTSSLSDALATAR